MYACIYYIGNLESDTLEDCSDSCDDYIDVTIEYYLDNNCMNGTWAIQKTALVYGCLNYISGRSELYNCSEKKRMNK